jgi:hypothetical protein
MLGPGPGTGDSWSSRPVRSPRRLLSAADRCSGGVQRHLPGWACASKRPFAPPGWPSVSERPLRDQCSRPASSAPLRTALTPVRLRTPRLALRSPGAGRIVIRHPLRVALPAPRQVPRAPLSFGTFQSLQVIARRGWLSEARLNGTPDTFHSPSTARFRCRYGSSLQVRSVPPDSLFRLSLGTGDYVASKSPGRQTKSLELHTISARSFCLLIQWVTQGSPWKICE